MFNVEIGAPEPVLNAKSDYLGVFRSNGDRFYTPPVSQKALAKLRHVNAHHGTALTFKRNMLTKHFIPNELISLNTFKKLAFDCLVFGHCYPRVIKNRLGGMVRIAHLPAINMRRLIDDNERYCWVESYNKTVDFAAGDVIQLKDYDLEQSLYGIPDWYPALQALLLNESATLFRRRYFANGNHAGFIFYTNDANMSADDEAALKDAIKNSKGVGNFRSIYLNIPGGDPDGVKLIPVGDISTKDEFQRIKDISRNDIISAHRVPPALAAVMPENTGGFGDIEKISRVYYENEVLPLQNWFLEINDMLGRNVVQFAPIENMLNQ